MSDKKILKFKQPAEFYYRMAQKLMDNGRYVNALSAIRKAVDMEPEDYEYSLCLAEVLTELTKYEDSNRVLFDIIERGDDVSAECFFCLGCNFMGLNDIPKAQESFEKYIQVQPEGEYREEVEDFLYYFDSEEYGEYYEEDGEDEEFEKAREGKRYLDRGEYEKAVETLEAIDNEDGEMSYAKNNLALAYYCLKNIVKAMEITRKVLKKNKANLHANCNMAVFMSEVGRMQEAAKHVNAALKAKTETSEDIYKIAITLCELKRHEEAISYLKELAAISPYDEKVLYYLAAAYHNTGRPKEAINLLDDIKKLDHPGVIADYYIRRINQEIQEPESYEEMAYVYQVPAEEAKKKIKYLNDSLKLPDSEYSVMWKQDAVFQDTILWGLEYGDENIKRAIAGMVAGFADRRAERILRDFLLKKRQPDEVKNDIFVLLKRMSAKEPYIAYISGEVVEVKVGAYDLDAEGMGKEYSELFHRLYDAINMYYSEDVLRCTLEVIAAYLEKQTGEPGDVKINETAAALLYLALRDCGQEEDLAAVCGRLEADAEGAMDVVRMMGGSVSSGIQI